MQKDSIIAVRMENEIITAKVVEVDGLQLTARLFTKKRNRRLVIANWTQAVMVGRVVCKRDTSVIQKRKTVVVCEVLWQDPTWLQRLASCCRGFKLSHSRIKRMKYDVFGYPRFYPYWQRKMKVTGTVFSDGFFIPAFGQRYQFPLYFEQYDQTGFYGKRKVSS